MLFFLDVGHQVGVSVTGHDEDTLVRVPVLVRMFVDIEQIIVRDRNHDPLEGDASLRLQEFVLLSATQKGPHAPRVPSCEPFVLTPVGTDMTCSTLPLATPPPHTYSPPA